MRWDVEVANQDGEIVAAYDLLTMNATAQSAAVPSPNGSTEASSAAQAVAR